jgi:hypothetical protein
MDVRGGITCAMRFRRVWLGFYGFGNADRIFARRHFRRTVRSPMLGTVGSSGIFRADLQTRGESGATAPGFRDWAKSARPLYLLSSKVMLVSAVNFR